MLALGLTVNSQNLIKIWETDTLMAQPESAVYDSINGVIYVSNINGKYCAHDGNGFISKVDLTGNIVELKWVTGLDSPQGLALHGNNLYVADNEHVIKIDARQGKIVKVLKISSAIFLNDAAVDNSGVIFISDCETNKIYKIKNDSVSVWLDDPLLKGPNGLLGNARNLLVLNMGDGVLYSVDKDTKAITEFSSGIKNCDGITSDGEDGFFVSGAWQGEIYHINSSGEKLSVLNLWDEKIITADIHYIAGKKLLLVPTLNKTILAYGWKNK